MAKAGKILIGLTAGLLLGCVTDYNSVAPPTELVVNVQNNSGVNLTGAEVYIYDDEASFTQTISTGTPANFFSTATTTNGSAILTKLNPDVIYFLYVLYKDNSIYPGTFITFDNSTEKFQIKNKLNQGSLTTVSTVLTAADGLITFWTGPANSTVLPIDMYLGTSLKGTVTQTSLIQPGIFQPGATTLHARKGIVNTEGKSAAGCLWVNPLTLSAAQSIFYNLSDCGVGTIAFYTDNSNATKVPISIILNANDAVPALATPSASVPINCSAANLSRAVRVAGNYTYLATSTVGSCVWTGSFSLAVNECKLIPLNTCP